MDKTFNEKTLGERLVLAAWTAVHLHLAQQRSANVDDFAPADQPINTGPLAARFTDHDRQLLR